MTDVYYVFNELGHDGKKMAQRTLLRADAVQEIVIAKSDRDAGGAETLRFDTYTGNGYKAAVSWSSFEAAQDELKSRPSNDFAPLTMIRVTDRLVLPAKSIVSASPLPGFEATASCVYMDGGTLRLEEQQPGGRNGAKQTQITEKPLAQYIHHNGALVSDIEAGLKKAGARLVYLG